MKKLFLLLLILMLPFATLAQESQVKLTCSDTTVEGAEVGDSFLATCPEDCDEGTIWGTDIYTDDSNVCTAAAHAGVINLEDGGEFTINFIEGQEEYESSEQNGISSSSWGSWDLSFTFNSGAMSIDWGTAANEFDAVESGESFTVMCPEDGEESSLWGTDIYTDDSSICTAAVHAGVIDLDDGGLVTVTILDGQEEYEGSESNDIESSNWGSWDRSFSVSSGDDMEIEIVELEWSNRGNEFEGDAGDFFFAECPEDGDESSLWGTGVYTDDSSICTAAAHMGIFDVDDGGIIAVVFLDGFEVYTGSEQSDISSSDWGSWSRSFVVSGIVFGDVVEIGWDTAANEFDDVESGESFVVSCPEDGDEGSLWGTGVYTDDSSICTVGVHTGLIDADDGGEMTVTILDGLEEYTGSVANDIESSNWGSWERSFAVSG